MPYTKFGRFRERARLLAGHKEPKTNSGLLHHLQAATCGLCATGYTQDDWEFFQTLSYLCAFAHAYLRVL